MSRNFFTLKHYVDHHHADLIFLSEPQIFAHDLAKIMRPLAQDYQACLNSEDRYDPELPLIKSRTHGGTLVLWKSYLDPHVTVLPLTTTSFLPILFHPPGFLHTIHICVYLPTAGKESQFLDELAKLTIAVEELSDSYPEAPIYLRGDFNASLSNAKRNNLLIHFCSEFGLLEVPIPFPTYHHFLGSGLSDSFLDKLLYSESVIDREILIDIHCKLSDPLIESHHDMIISSWSVPEKKEHLSSDENIVAPKVVNNRQKVVWSDTGIEEYQKLVVPHLARLQELWLQTPSRTSISLLLESTNSVLTSSAAATNKTIALDGSQNFLPSRKTPRTVLLSQKSLLKKHRLVRNAATNGSPDYASLKEEYNRARILHRKLEREHKAGQSTKRDESLFGIVSSNPSSVFKNIKASKRGAASKIYKLNVDNKTYVGDHVQDGFYDSISKLKMRDLDAQDASSTFSDFASEYSNILEICKHGPEIPPISESDAFKLMERMKKNVTDVYGVTINHYYLAGPAGWKHFYLLLNTLLSDVNSTDISEINTVYACILFKGHNKDKCSDRSYRTISSCPVVAKGLDLYIRDLNIDSWNLDQADTQFQGEGSSHELAAVLLTETIQYSLFTLKQPVYVLYLDAQSAFDVVLRELLIRNLFHNTGTSGNSLLFINNRLGSRRTFIDWDGKLMGPICDERGLEQGGINSSDQYKIFGKEQLTTAQDSSLGVKFKSWTVSGIGQADDTLLLSNCLFNLFCLLQLSIAFCKRYHVKLCPEKTKLQAFYTKDMETLVNYAKETNPLHIDGQKIEFVDTAEHVGMLRSPSGNLPTILTRMAAHKKALGVVMHAGIARGHRGNPAAGLYVDNVYGVPVFLSGLAPIVLSKPELTLISQHHKQTISNLQRLLPCTPRSVVCFLAGSLPGEALLHIRQLTIFGMITRLSGNLLNKLALDVFDAENPPKNSWFAQLQDLCLQYCLPLPHQLLEHPLQKPKFKRMIKKHVLNYWEELLRIEAEDPRYSSLEYFRPRYMSLTSPHPLWTTAGSSPANVSMASIQAQMVSGRYRCESLCRHWSSNKEGFCLLSPACSETVEDLPHILRSCHGLHRTREKLVDFTIKYSTSVPVISDLILNLSNPTNPDFCQFLLDCSPLQPVIQATQKHGQEVLHHLFRVSRTWVYTLHKARMKILGRWNIV